MFDSNARINSSPRSSYAANQMEKSPAKSNHDFSIQVTNSYSALNLKLQSLVQDQQEKDSNDEKTTVESHRPRVSTLAGFQAFKSSLKQIPKGNDLQVRDSNKLEKFEQI